MPIRIAVVATGILPSRDIRTSMCIGNRSHSTANRGSESLFRSIDLELLPEVSDLEDFLDPRIAARQTNFGFFAAGEFP